MVVYYHIPVAYCQPVGVIFLAEKVDLANVTARAELLSYRYDLTFMLGFYFNRRH